MPSYNVRRDRTRDARPAPPGRRRVRAEKRPCLPAGTLPGRAAGPPAPRDGAFSGGVILLGLEGRQPPPPPGGE